MRPIINLVKSCKIPARFFQDLAEKCIILAGVLQKVPKTVHLASFLKPLNFLQYCCKMLKEHSVREHEILQDLQGMQEIWQAQNSQQESCMKNSFNFMNSTNSFYKFHNFHKSCDRTLREMCSFSSRVRKAILLTWEDALEFEAGKSKPTGRCHHNFFEVYAEDSPIKRFHYPGELKFLTVLVLLRQREQNKSNGMRQLLASRQNFCHFQTFAHQFCQKTSFWGYRKQLEHNCFHLMQ